ncbi:hypothetical protein JCM10212_006573 [Sporobolomyces blumeae]
MSFEHQVGGHASTILTSPLSSSTLIKPSSPVELAFYQSLGPSLADGDLVGIWTPAFYGTLSLQGKVNGEGQVEQLERGANEAVKADGATPEMLVLENLTHRFVRPNVLDVKLGTVLYDEDASPEKQQRMRKAAASSTSGSLGLRLTGFQVWDPTTQAYHSTPKPFGRTLLETELAIGLSRFFYPSLSSPSSAELARSSTSDPPPSLPVPPEAYPPPLPTDLVLPVLRSFARRLSTLTELLRTLEIRIRGGSLLFVVEGDPLALEKSLLRAAARAGENGAADDSYDDEDDRSTTDGDGNAAEHTLEPFELRLIDFAHTRAAPGEGPDEGVVLGIENLRKGIEELIDKVEEIQREAEQRDSTRR